MPPGIFVAAEQFFSAVGRIAPDRQLQHAERSIILTRNHRNMLSLRQLFIFVVFISFFSLSVLGQQESSKPDGRNNVAGHERQSVSVKTRKWRKKTRRHAKARQRAKQSRAKLSARKHHRKHKANSQAKLSGRHKSSHFTKKESLDTSRNAGVQSGTEAPDDDLQGALEYGFNMTKGGDRYDTRGHSRERTC